ncbi:hypothetical protein VTG60DRAFT_99 [Thermothelomyces hinnuleus]
MAGKITRERKSVFRELGLDTDLPSQPSSVRDEHEFGEPTELAPASPASTHAVDEGTRNEDDGAENEAEGRPTQQEQGNSNRAESRSNPASPSETQRPCYYRAREEGTAPAVADAGVIDTPAAEVRPVLERRNSPTDVCKRWAHQVPEAAHLNGTLYIYGGQATTSKGQEEDTWNNDFLTLDLTKSRDTSSPALRGLPEPSGPPAVSLGYLWNDYSNLYLYGGESADNPFVELAPFSTWKHSIGSQTWTEYPSPKTSAGKNSAPGDQPVQRAAEGAGLSVPELDLSWYFGGRLDLSTTPGWSNQIVRVYLKSLVEFTHPHYTNDGVFSLADGIGAGDGGVYRNITEGGLQVDDGFPERADGVLVFVPGWGEKGVLISLARGSNDTFVDDLSTLVVYDIARWEWYQQKTTVEPPSVRVNPCAVTASAPDASSFQVYLYGGPNLQPYGEQVQYSDMYILNIPSFTWIKVPRPDNSPPARAGHTCTLRDGQIVIVCGYTGNTPSCESPGIHVFNATSLSFQPQFRALAHAADHHPENSVLAASFGYRVADLVASVIGGDGDGGATVTTPAAGPATGGPFWTGTPPVFTVTTASPSPGGSSSSSSSSPPGPHDAPTGGLIAAGVLAGVAGLAVAYLGYCAWLYRRQVRAYRTHLAVVNRYSPAPGTSPGGLAGAGLGGGRGHGGGGRGGGKRGEGGDMGEMADRWSSLAPLPPMAIPASKRFSISRVDSAPLGWAMPPTEPPLLFDGEHRSSLGSRPGSGSGSGSGPKPEPSFFSVVLGPRRALRVVNGLEGDRDSIGE